MIPPAEIACTSHRQNLEIEDIKIRDRHRWYRHIYIYIASTNDASLNRTILYSNRLSAQELWMVASISGMISGNQDKLSHDKPCCLRDHSKKVIRCDKWILKWWPQISTTQSLSIRGQHIWKWCSTPLAAQCLKHTFLTNATARFCR